MKQLKMNLSVTYIMIIICVLFLCSCGNSYVAGNGHLTAKPTIEMIIVGDKNMAKYYLTNTGLDYEMEYFYDSIGKFNVGDTVKLSK